MCVELLALCSEPPPVWVLRQKHTPIPFPAVSDAVSGRTPGCGSSLPCPKSRRPQHWLGLSSSTSNLGPCLHNRRFSPPRPVPAAHGLLPRTVMPRAGRPSEGLEERGTLPTPCWLEGQPAGSPGDLALGWKVPFSAPRGPGALKRLPGWGIPKSR